MKMQGRSLSLATALVIGLSAVAPLAHGDDSMAGPAISLEVQSRVAGALKDPTTRDVSHLFQTLKSRSTYVLNELKQYPDLKSSYFFFDPRALIFSTQVSRQEKMIAQMDFAKSELSDSKLVRLKVLKDELQQKAAALKEKNVALRIQMGEAVSAQELGWADYVLTQIPVANLLAPSVKETLEARISANEKLIVQTENEENYVVDQLVASLQSYGIKVDANQIKILFATVAGDQDLQIISAYDNVRKLTVLIQEQLKPGQTTIDLGREYYGMYALMLASLIRIHETQLSQIQDVYLAKITDLISKAESNRAQAKSLLAQSPDSAILKSNIKANQQMIEVSSQYRDYLTARASRIEKSIKERRQAYLEVLNTYKTYDVAQGILEIIQTSQANLNALDALSISELPQLVDLGDTNIIDQLTQVTIKISKP